MASGDPRGGRAAAIAAARKCATAALPEGVARSLSRMRGQIAEWAPAEIAPGRLLPWLPVAFGAGIALAAPVSQSDATPQLESFETGD
jgi:competence protein ComEC